MSFEEMFWARVDKTDPSGCWLWIGYISPKGYGEFTRKHIRAHRFSWQIANGQIPEGLNVLHKCDITFCVRPDHLFLGTQPDNVADMIAKGRNRTGRLFGEDNPRHKMTPEKILVMNALFEAGVSAINLAKMFGVTRNYIYDVRKGRLWKGLLEKQ